MAYHLSREQVSDDNGIPLPLATLTFYVTGTTTPLDTFSDAALTSANLNPLPANAAGRFGDIYLSDTTYKVVLKNAAGVTVWTEDPVCKEIQRIRASALPTVNWPGFQVYDTADGNLYERNSTDTAWINRGPIDAVGNTSTVAQVLAGTDAASFVTPLSLAGLWGQGTDIGTITANNISLPSSGGGVFNVTAATTTVTTISSATQGREVELIFTNAQTITHGSGINTIGAVTYDVPAGSRVRFQRDSSSWTIIWHQLGARYALIKRTVFGVGTNTWTRAKGTAAALFRGVGGGGAGGGTPNPGASNAAAGGGGQAGGYAELFKITPASTYTITIPAIAAGSSNATGATGGNVTVGAILTCNGGSGGTAGSATANANINGLPGSAAGTASGGDFSYTGSPGRPGINGTSGGSAAGGNGGASPFGGVGLGAVLVAAGTTAGSAASGAGSGGGGGAGCGSNAATAGGSGGAGAVIVDEYAMV